jgi:hypothetical protein
MDIPEKLATRGTQDKINLREYLMGNKTECPCFIAH